MNASEFEELNGRAIADYAATERQLCRELNVSRPVDQEWLDACRAYIRRPEGQLIFQRARKPWSIEIAEALRMGVDPSTQRIVFPVYDRDGLLVNARLYLPGGNPKFIWKVQGEGGNFVWPREAWDENPIILTEGETDALTLRSHGFPAASGTLGAKRAVPDMAWAHGRNIWLMMDSDSAGREAAAESANLLRGVAASVMQISLPQWDGMPDNADVSDYVAMLYSVGHRPDQVQAAISALLASASTVQTSEQHRGIDETSFRSALSAEMVGRRVRFSARITARSVKRYILPIEMRITCSGGAGRGCRRCPMTQQYGGSTTVTIEPQSVDTFKLVEVTSHAQSDFIKRQLGIDGACGQVIIEPVRSVDVEPVLVQEPPSGSDRTSDRQYREAYFILNGQTIEEGRDYSLVGSVYPHPREQLAVFLADEYERLDPAPFEASITPEMMRALDTFRPSEGQTAFEKLCEVADDLADGVTYIYGRRDLHLAYRTVWHSMIQFSLAGTPLRRGWLEALVVGDTRCGKSMTFNRMAEFYGIGTIVDCKMQSVAGILGGVEKTQTGKFYAIPGIMPQNDLGIICFDEFKAIGGGDLMQALAVTRSDGIVKISKVASAEFKARVRSIWLANPGRGKIISQQALTGIEIIEDIIPQPEDVARFDFAMVVRQEDVKRSELTRVHRPRPPKYSEELSRALLSWSYSISSVVFEQDALTAMSQLAESMCDEYSSTIPIVEPADQLNRIARICVSIALQLYSHDGGGSAVVTRDHVDAAKTLFGLWYRHEGMGYAEYTGLVKDTVDRGETESIDAFFAQFGEEDARWMASEFMKLEIITPTLINSIVPGGPMVVQSISPISALQRLGCLRAANRGRSMGYEKTSTFVGFLRDYLSR